MWIMYYWIFIIITNKFLIQALPARGKRPFTKKLNQKRLENKLVFPDSEEQVEDDSVESVPGCGNNRTFCEDVTNYPAKKFQKILQDAPLASEYFKLLVPISEDAVSSRFSTKQEHFLCKSIKRTEFPRVAYNLKQQRKFIYNLQGYRQGVRIEECQEEAACTVFEGRVFGIKTKCTQKYSQVTLLVADDEGKPVWDDFWFPSACMCSYQPIINFYRT